MHTDTPPSAARPDASDAPDAPDAPDAGDDLAGLGEELAETIADIRDEGRWLMANLRELASAFGFGPGSTTP